MNFFDRLTLALDSLNHLGEIAGGDTVNGVIQIGYFVVMLIILLLSTALQILLTPKPPLPKPASLDDFTVPTADQSRPIPVIFGTVRVTGPNVTWFGDLYSEPIPAPE